MKTYYVFGKTVRCDNNGALLDSEIGGLGRTAEEAITDAGRNGYNLTETYGEEAGQIVEREGDWVTLVDEQDVALADVRGMNNYVVGVIVPAGTTRKVCDLSPYDLDNSGLDYLASVAGYASLKALLNDKKMWGCTVSEVTSFLTGRNAAAESDN